MNGREFWALRDVSDEELEASLGSLLGAGARLEARIVAHLAEVEERRLHLLAGYSSLYDYCRKRLALSDFEAFARIAAARVARKYPVVFGMLERRELHLTAICEVREFLTTENHRGLLAEVSGQTKLQIRETLARRFPQADVAASLKKLPAFEPLSPDRYRLLLTLSGEQKRKFELARDLLSHANPTGDLAIVFERALDELLTQLEKRRFGQRQAKAQSAPRTLARAAADSKQNSATQHDSQGSGAKDNGNNGAKDNGNNGAKDNGNNGAKNNGDNAVSRQGAGGSGHHPEEIGEIEGTKAPRRPHIRHSVRRELLARDGARCTFIGRDGARCEGREFLQIHHQHPWALGGSDTTDNLALLCQAHNRLLAEQDFGKAQIERAVSHRTTQTHSRRRER